MSNSDLADTVPPGERVWELLLTASYVERCACLYCCFCQHVHVHVRWNTNNTVIGGNQFVFWGTTGKIMLLCSSAFLVCLPQFLPFSPPSLCCPLPSFLSLSEKERALFPFMSPNRCEVPMKGSRLALFSSR